MPSLVVDVLLGLLLLCSAYILFGRQAASGEPSNRTTRKKKRSKASKTSRTKAASTETASQTLTASQNGQSESLVSNSAPNSQPPYSRSQASTVESKKAQKSKRPQPALSESLDEDEDFPPLSSSKQPTASRSPPTANGGQQIPLAERLAKRRPVTAVDDMVEKDDELQGEQIYSRTMRIVKPQETKPLLLDDGIYGDEEWEKAQQESLSESAWQSVPVSSKKPPTLRVSHTSSSQVSSQTSSRSIPGLPELTKKQRQNARKAAEAKAAKETAEHDRLQRLAAHKRALEKERMALQYKSKGSTAPPQTQKSKREEVGGGMRAAVYDGKLIWE